MEGGEKQKAARRMQAYIAEHITEAITLRMLADAAGYSPWHAERIFKEVTGQTPFEYLRATRLSQAAAQLRDTDARVIDVAFDFVFGSHEGFTRAFSKHFGLSPQEYRKHAARIPFLLPHHLGNGRLILPKGANAMSDNLGTTITQVIHRPVFIQVVDRPARKLILKRGVNATHYYEYCEEVGCEIWQILTNIKEALYEPIGMWMPDNLMTPGTSFYTQGVEVSVNYTGKIPAGFEIIDLPPAR